MIILKGKCLNKTKPSQSSEQTSLANASNTDNVYVRVVIEKLLAKGHIYRDHWSNFYFIPWS
jgi:hypothetical protein